MVLAGLYVNLDIEVIQAFNCLTKNYSSNFNRNNDAYNALNQNIILMTFEISSCNFESLMQQKKNMQSNSPTLYSRLFKKLLRSSLL